tara:strand:- start:1789 stop:2385 length:597 start_codon:yes stop_codon:yes gene_type:complete
MKPRPVESGYLAKAQELEQRLDRLLKAEDEHKKKIIACLKKKGGAASLEECAKECGISTGQCKKVINSMDNVKMSPHGDVMLTDGLQKGEGEDCPKCKGGKLNKMGQCMKMGCGGKMAKAEPGFKAEKITDVNPAFMSETGGQTKSGYFTTNGRTIETEDAKPKRAKDNKKVDLGKLGGRMNPHAGTGVEREDSAGER